MIRKCYAFSSCKQRKKVCVAYLGCKLQQDGYGWWIFKLKCEKKRVELTCLKRGKNKKDTSDAFRYKSANEKVRIVFLVPVNNQARYSVFI